MIGGRGREWDDISTEFAREAAEAEPRPCAYGQVYGKVAACDRDALPDSDFCVVHADDF